jgi:hypothetical protein
MRENENANCKMQNAKKNKTKQNKKQKTTTLESSYLVLESLFDIHLFQRFRAAGAAK